MGYQGYLLKVASTSTSNDWFTIPHNFIKERSYKGTYSTMDLNSTRNANAVLDRNVVEHKVPHCVMTIKPLNDDKLATLFGVSGGITTRYADAKEKSIYCKMWVPELNDYVTVLCYVPDIDFTIKKVVNTSPYSVDYDEFELEFIGY